MCPEQTLATAKRFAPEMKKFAAASERRFSICGCGTS
jgi:hypothetical protein